MRKEADDIGPRAELDHWKKRMSKFNYLLDQIKSHDVKTVLGILQTAKSKSIKVRPQKSRDNTRGDKIKYKTSGYLKSLYSAVMSTFSTKSVNFHKTTFRKNLCSAYLCQRIPAIHDYSLILCTRYGRSWTDVSQIQLTKLRTM